MTIYKILGSEIKVSTGIENSRFIKNAYLPHVAKSTEFFNKWYSACSNFGTVKEEIPDFLAIMLDPIVTQSLEILNENKIYAYDNARLFDRFFDNCFEDLFEVVKDIWLDYSVVEIDQENAHLDRQERKENRARYVGYGWDFSSTVKAKAKAGMKNAASGLAHSARNAIGNLGTDIAANVKKANLYSSGKNRLADEIENSIWCIMAEMRSILKEEKNMCFEFQPNESKEKGSAILKNYLAEVIPESQRKESLIQALNLNYYNKELYQTIWLCYGDKTGDLRRMANDFDLSITNYIDLYCKKYEEEACKEYCPEFLKSNNYIRAAIIYENEIKRAVADVEFFCKSHHVNLEQFPKREYLLNCLDIADRSKRTVEDVLYDNEGEAEKVRNDIALFNSTLQNKNIFDDDTHELILTQNYQSDLFIQKIEDRLDKEKELRTPNKILHNIFNTISLIENNSKLTAMLGIPNICGNTEDTKAVFGQICTLESNETVLALFDRSIGLFNGKGKGKSGVLFTNLNLRIFSKQLLSKENECFAIDRIKNIEALGEHKYLLSTVEDTQYTFDLAIKDLLIEEQNRLAEIMLKCVQLINHIFIDHRIQLDRMLVPESIKCICGKYILPSEKKCPFCHRFIAEDGTLVESIVCPNCDNHVKPNAHFCNKCGYNFMPETKVSIGEEETLIEERIEVEVPPMNTETIVETTICKSCGKEILSGKKFCKYCGSSVSDLESQSVELLCPNCSNRIKAGKKFCSKCGTQILK